VAVIHSAQFLVTDILSVAQKHSIKHVLELLIAIMTSKVLQGHWQQWYSLSTSKTTYTSKICQSR